MLEGQNLTLLLLGVIAPIGALDAVWFHVIRFRLASRPESRAETGTHVARSLVLGVVSLVLAFATPAGVWFWLLAGLLVFDFANNLVDAFLEHDSRAGLGGVPRVEYLIHIAGATWVGAASLAFLVQGWPFAASGTGLLPPVVPIHAALKANAVLIAVGCFALAGLETAMVLASLRRR